MLERIGKYEIKKPLGKGATGTVYLAADPFRQADVAIKVMERLPTDPDAARRGARPHPPVSALEVLVDTPPA